MDIEIKISAEQNTPKIVIVAKEITEEISELLKRLSAEGSNLLVGFKDGVAYVIDFEDLFNIYAEGQKVFATAGKEKLLIKSRLYEIEERFAGLSLLRISNSEIVNFKKVKSMDMSISGTISLLLSNGNRAFVSRRYVEAIKKHLGI